MLERRTILFVDDSERWHALYQSALEADLQCQVNLINDGSQALQSLTQGTLPALIILDLHMPGMSGEQVLKAIRANRKYDQMPVVMLTGEASYETQEQLLEAGANDFIDKGAPYGLLLARLKAQLRQIELQDQLTGVALDLDVFAAGILHDMHNLEHGLMAYGYLLEKKVDELPPSGDKNEMKTYLSGITEQLRRLSSYATDVIQAVRGGSGGEMALSVVSWKDSVDWAFTVLNSTQRSLGLAEIKINCPANWLAVLGQPEMMNLISLNLLQNSIKYARSGVASEVAILQSLEQINGQEMVVTRFCDNGSGIAKEDLSRIFQPFVRSLDSAKSSQRGFGMGLALVARAARAMQGLVWAEERSDQKAGSVLTVAVRHSP